MEAAKQRAAKAKAEAEEMARKEAELPKHVRKKRKKFPRMKHPNVQSLIRIRKALIQKKNK